MAPRSEHPAGSTRVPRAIRSRRSTRYLQLEHGIVITGDEGSIPSLRPAPGGESTPAGHPVAPLQRMPPLSALRECLSFQADEPPQSFHSRLFGVHPIAREARRSYSGALAELAVTESLSALGSEWTVLHSVPLAGERQDDDRSAEHRGIDHLVIGPAGIFTLSVESHAGQALWVGERTFIADGERLDHLARADETGRAVTLLLGSALAAAGIALEIVVTPCVVVDAPATLEVRQRPGRIQVVTARSFAAWLTGLPRMLSPTVVEEIVAVAVAASSWPSGSLERLDSGADTHERRAEFERLRLRVSSARFRRLLWTGLGVVVSYGAVILNLGGLTALELTSALGR
ncbi:NERD domain-containing protein [Glaciihabitans sp. INWT7]|uniref:nuclease-related domain-containing protein n=1 Tax=Glaciihabitans sp. INWT7 TaxID=2596912 RepID=UPI001628D32D|nr:nuclease-related domain-containing protein [Glaciihabitans sp. INWT7]QNE46502.1 NERD domain-containing protein [Glaciihabitans sp. INWT7]